MFDKESVRQGNWSTISGIVRLGLVGELPCRTTSVSDNLLHLLSDGYFDKKLAKYLIFTQSCLRTTGRFSTCPNAKFHPLPCSGNRPLLMAGAGPHGKFTRDPLSASHPPTQQRSIKIAKYSLSLKSAPNWECGRLCCT